MDFSSALKSLMDARGIKQADLARMAGISTAQASNLCTGRTKDPTLSTAMAISRAFGVSLDYLAGNETEDYLILTDREKHLVKQYQNMNEAAKSTVDAVVSSMEKDTANRIEKEGEDSDGKSAVGA